MAGEEFLIAAGAAFAAGGIAAIKRGAAQMWFERYLRLPGPSLEKLGGAQVCIYQGGPPPSDWTVFKGACDRLYQYRGFDRHRARARADVERIIGSYPSIARLVLAGHGDTNYFMGQWGPGLSITAAQLAEYMRGRIAPNAIISLAGCSAGRSDDEPERYTGEIGVGGSASFAGTLRDRLADMGAPGTAEIRAHTTRGPATENPRGRIFRVSERGQGGRPILLARGPEAERWILAMSGLDELVRDPVNAVGLVGVVAGIGLAGFGIYRLVKERF